MGRGTARARTRAGESYKGLHRVYRTVSRFCMSQSYTQACSPGSHKNEKLSAPIYTALFVRVPRPCFRSGLGLGGGDTLLGWGIDRDEKCGKIGVWQDIRCVYEGGWAQNKEKEKKVMKEWKNRLRLRRGLAVSLAVAVIGSCLHVDALPVFAAEQAGDDVVTEEMVTQNIPVSEGELADSDELFAGYVEKVFYEGLNEGISTLGNVGEDRLQGEYNQKIYAVLKDKVRQIAAGTQRSTEISLTFQELGLQNLSWTAWELGYPSSPELAFQVAEQKCEELISTSDLMMYLLMDCPYELYWFDKVSGMNRGYSMRYTGQSMTVSGIYISFVVSNEYRYGNDAFTVDSAKISKIPAAVANAKRIVQANENKTDYEKLVAYRQKICELVSYNYAAAETSNPSDLNPWQLIWVFDNDPSTNVVCEGYAKAFQYLCDLSTFADTICYTVTGLMDGGTGAGLHMWNVVTMDGKNYLVDVTNCDEGTIGADDQLFLAGAYGSVTGAYIVDCGYASVAYGYDPEMLGLYGSEILTLSASDYVPKIIPMVSASQRGTVTYGDPVDAKHIQGTATADGTEIAGTFSWASDVTSYGAAGTKTLKAIFSPNQADVYEKMIVMVNLTVSPADYQVTVTTSQDIRLGDGTFVQPTFTGVSHEAVAGTLTYTYNQQTMTYDQLKAALSGLTTADMTVTVGYSFVAADANYITTAKTGTLTFTLKQITFAPGESDNNGQNHPSDWNTPDNKDEDGATSGVVEGTGNPGDTAVYGTKLISATPTKFNTIMLNWDAVAGATSYEIYYSTSSDSGFKRLANVKKTFYKFSKAKCGVTYYFQMRVCQKKIKSEFGPVSYAKTDLTGSTMLQVKKTTYNSVSLKWSKVAGAKKYEIFYADSIGGTWQSLGLKGGTSFTHRKLVTGATYYYQVRPVRDSFQGSWSNGVSTTTRLENVSKLKVQASGADRLKVSFRKVKGASQYVILRADSVDGDYEVIGRTGKSSYMDTGLRSGTTYFYKVYAISGPYRTKETEPVGQTTKIPKK